MNKKFLLRDMHYKIAVIIVKPNLKDSIISFNNFFKNNHCQKKLDIVTKTVMSNSFPFGTKCNGFSLQIFNLESQ